LLRLSYLSYYWGGCLKKPDFNIIEEQIPEYSTRKDFLNQYDILRKSLDAGDYSSLQISNSENYYSYFNHLNHSISNGLIPLQLHLDANDLIIKTIDGEPFIYPTVNDIALQLLINRKREIRIGSEIVKFGIHGDSIFDLNYQFKTYMEKISTILRQDVQTEINQRAYMFSLGNCLTHYRRVNNVWERRVVGDLYFDDGGWFGRSKLMVSTINYSRGFLGGWYRQAGHLFLNATGQAVVSGITLNYYAYMHSESVSSIDFTAITFGRRTSLESLNHTSTHGILSRFFLNPVFLTDNDVEGFDVKCEFQVNI